MGQKIIVADIDGTLVEKYQDVEKFERDMIEEARKKGALFGIASGRPLYHCIDLVKTWDLETDFFICQNGCNLYDSSTKKEYNYDLLKPQWCKEIIELMSQFDVNVMIYYNEKSYCSKLDTMVEEANKKYQYGFEIIDDLSFFYKDIEKLMFRIDEKDIDRAMAVIKEHPSKYYKGFKTQTIMIEFCNINVSKGETLSKYCDMKNIDLKDVYAFGDTENDEDMLKVAGHGICMKNGSPSTKAIADDITERGCDDNGVGYYIADKILPFL